MMDRQQLRIPHLLEKFERGEASPEEIVELDLWFDSFENRPELTASMSHEQYQNAKSELLGRIENLLDYQPKSNVPNPRSLWPRLLVAGMLLLAMTIGGYFLLKESPVPAEFTQTSQPLAMEISPGGNRATLTLEDGRVVDLSEDQSGIRVGENLTYLDGSNVLERQQTGELRTARHVLQTPKGGTYRVLLPDGTAVWLNAASRLTYPSTFSSDRRLVELEGEGYFEVAHRPDQPFIVQASGQEVQVLGTQFNISSYPDEAAIFTTLVEGRVEVRAADHKVTLRPGQQSVFRSGELLISEVRVEPFVAWKNGEFLFDQAPIQQVMGQLAKWYDIEVVYGSGVPQAGFTGVISRDKPLRQVLSMLEQTDLVHFRQEGRRLHVMAR